MLRILQGLINRNRSKKALLHDTPSHDAVPLTILTANVGNVFPSEMTKAFKLRDEDLPTIAENISNLDPDIVFLQELATLEQSEILFPYSKYHSNFVRDNCTAVRRGLFRNLQLESVGDAFTICRADLYLPGKHVRVRDVYSVYLFNVHTGSPLKDPTFSSRGHQINEVLDAIELTARSKALIAAGDFNFDPYPNSDNFLQRYLGARQDLAETRNRWLSIFAPGFQSGLTIPSMYMHSWNNPFSSPLTSKKLALDHVITNLNSVTCLVLDGLDNRLDIARRGRGGLDAPRALFSPASALTTIGLLSQIKKGFMDHRGIVVRLTVPNKSSVS